jgi:fluoride exporter
VSPLAWVGFVAAAAIGAPLRYVVDVSVGERVGGRFPWGTLVINASGSLLLGVLTGLVLYHAFPKTPKVILGTGFCGAYTTFSTFAYETVGLAEDGATGPPCSTPPARSWSAPRVPPSAWPRPRCKRAGSVGPMPALLEPARVDRWQPLPRCAASSGRGLHPSNRAPI